MLTFDFFIYTLCCRLQINIAILFQCWFLNCISEQIYVYFLNRDVRNGTIHISMMKNWASHILFLKKGGLSYTGSAEKGGYSARTSALCHI